MSEVKPYVISKQVVWEAYQEVKANHGAAGVFGPPDHGMPADGVVALGAMNVPGWTYAEVDTANVHRLRAEGGASSI